MTYPLGLQSRGVRDKLKHGGIFEAATPMAMHDTGVVWHKCDHACNLLRLPFIYFIC